MTISNKRSNNGHPWSSNHLSISICYNFKKQTVQVQPTHITSASVRDIEESDIVFVVEEREVDGDDKEVGDYGWGWVGLSASIFIVDIVGWGV